MYKPVILLGNGARGNPALVAHLCSLGVPVLTTWMAADLVPEDSPVFCGRPGIYGQRAANIIQQKADALYCFGARLDEGQVAYRYDRFAPNAVKYVQDVDADELNKLPDKWKKLCVNLNSAGMPKIDGDPDWLAWCKALYARFRPELEGHDDPEWVDPMRFMSLFSDYAQPEDVIVSGAGKAGEIFLQCFKVKASQRLLQLSTIGAMGYDIPLAIGAAVASGRRILCVTGDGGFQLNSPELEVVRRLKLPVQFFVFSNRGYASIRMMQKIRFNGNIVGADPESGFTIPTLASLAECYGLTYQRLENLQLVDWRGQLIELMIDPEYVHAPRVATSLVGGKWVQDDMSDMTPKLPAEELKEILDYD